MAHLTNRVKYTTEYERSCYLLTCVTIFSCRPPSVRLASSVLLAIRLAGFALAKPFSPAPSILLRWTA
jgi:hypothetical protein